MSTIEYRMKHLTQNVTAIAVQTQVILLQKSSRMSSKNYLTISLVEILLHLVDEN